jgi:sugar lactone lactonase YvrE
MRKPFVFSLLLLAGSAMTSIYAGQDVRSSGSYQLVDNWAQLPAGESFEGVSAVTTDPKGTVHAFRRDGGNIWTLDAAGKRIKIWGQNSAKWTHGIRVDRNGFIWTTDGQGHQVKKWSSDGGQLLMTLGKYEVPGDNTSQDLFNRPTDVVVAPNGDFFISDGYVNSRVVKFDKEGRFLKIIGGTKGAEPGQFNLPHGIAMDSRGRIMVADRENSRVQIFDQEGKFLDQWKHLGKPYGLYVSGDDKLYVADGGTHKIWIVNASDGKVLDTIEGTNQIHSVSVDPAGNVYAASNLSKYLRKYVKRSR